MEGGGFSLEESLQHFERGIGLTRQCQIALTNVEQQVKILLEKNGESVLETFSIADENVGDVV